ncbi:hypothetical protein [Sphingomonas sp. BE137]|jgi:hypothetical protein|uniref:hypothetical protein n=1 Tax=Sphingomonas sp. BE137 TaxID=2817844 RepID=UPI001AE4EE08|nr:hypothetical protein [Sphingomonas sp. BE137]MDR6846819.1 hypothetical protein [Sphingomonas sp. BE137]
MDGIHSRRHVRTALVEDCLSLDLAWIMRLGPIGDGQAGSGEIKWRVDGAALRSARFRLDLGKLESATLTICSETISQAVTLTALPQNFGGRRWWMRCPVTGERVRCLYLPPGGARFASRKALGLSYRVERLTRFDRPFEKLFRAQRRLGEVQGLGAGLKRPKGMWNRTYARHACRFDALDVACAEKIVALIQTGKGDPAAFFPTTGG